MRAQFLHPCCSELLLFFGAGSMQHNFHHHCYANDSRVYLSNVWHFFSNPITSIIQEHNSNWLGNSIFLYHLSTPLCWFLRVCVVWSLIHFVSQTLRTWLGFHAPLWGLVCEHTASVTPRKLIHMGLKKLNSPFRVASPQGCTFPSPLLWQMCLFLWHRDHNYNFHLTSLGFPAWLRDTQLESGVKRNNF